MKRNPVSVRLWSVCVCVYVRVLTTCQRADGTAVQTLAACPQWISSGGSPAQTCSVQDEMTSTSDTKPAAHSNTHTDTCQYTRVYLVEGRQVVSGLDEEGLVDSGMVHIVGGCRHQTKEDIQRTQLLHQLQHTSGSQGNGWSLCRRDTYFTWNLLAKMSYDHQRRTLISSAFTILFKLYNWIFVFFPSVI